MLNFGSFGDCFLVTALTPAVEPGTLMYSTCILQVLASTAVVALPHEYCKSTEYFGVKESTREIENGANMIMFPVCLSPRILLCVGLVITHGTSLALHYERGQRLRPDADADATLDSLLQEDARYLRYQGEKPMTWYIQGLKQGSLPLVLSPGCHLSSTISHFANSSGMEESQEANLHVSVYERIFPHLMRKVRMFLDVFWEDSKAKCHVEKQIRMLTILSQKECLPALIRAEASVGLAVRARCVGDMLAAQQAAEKALRLVSDYAPAANQLGIIYFSMRKFNHAFHAFKVALQTSNEPTEVMLNLGRALIWAPKTASNFSACTDFFSSALQVPESDFKALAILSIIEHIGDERATLNLGIMLKRYDLLKKTSPEKLGALWSTLGANIISHQAAVAIATKCGRLCDEATSRVLQLWKAARRSFLKKKSPHLGKEKYDRQIHLVLELFEAPQQRQLELMDALALNYDSKIHSIKILGSYAAFFAAKKFLSSRKLTNSVSGTSDKLEHWPLSSRANFSTAFDMIQNSIPEGDIVAVANADIALNADGWQMLYDLSKDLACDEMYAIQRRDWDELQKKWILRPRADMQDMWVMRTPISPKLPSITQFPFGKIGADNLLAVQLRSVEYKLFNPAHMLELRHFHASKIRTYSTEDSVDIPKQDAMSALVKIS